MNNDEFKQTDIGLIPKDWDLKPFSEISSMHGRIGWQGLKKTEFTENSEEPFLITGMNFKEGEIAWDEVYHVSVERYEIAKEIQLKTNDVLMTKDGTIGKILLVDRIPYPGKATLNSHLLVFRPIRDSYAPLFLYYLLSSKIFKDQIELNKSGSTFFGISQKAVGQFMIPLPKCQEQEEIASVLRETDNIINRLDKLIEKKKNIKQGAMQELLTGNRRLPGKWELSKDTKKTEIGSIPKDWQVLTFDDLFKFLSTGTNARCDLLDRGKVNYIHYGDIHAKWGMFLDCDVEEIPFISPEKIRSLPFSEDGDLVIADASEDYDGIGKCVEIRNVRDKRIVCGLHTIFLRGNKDKIVDGYKAFLTSISVVKNALISKATGISVYGVSKNSLKSIAVPLPVDLDEQKAISGILNDMELEIKELEQKRDKYRQLKIGMMQQLLTGRIRLKWAK